MIEYLEYNPAAVQELAESVVPGVVYHGSCYVFKKFMIKEQDPDSLYGPGFYFTDDAYVASQYSVKYEDELEIWKKDIKIKDLIKILKLRLKIAENERYIYIGDAEKYLKYVEQEGGEPEVSQFINLINIRDLLDFEHCTPNVWAARLVIKNPFVDSFLDENGRVEFELGLKMVDDFMDQDEYNRIAKQILKKEDFLTGFEFLRKKFSPWIIQKKLIQAGFDGITHVGGLILGRSKKLHTVWICFSPKQIIPAFEVEA